MDLCLGPSYELVLACDTNQESSRQVLEHLQRRFLPRKVLAVLDSEQQEKSAAAAALCEGKAMIGDSPTLYVCEGFSCQAPAQGFEEIEHALDNLD